MRESKSPATKDGTIHKASAVAAAKMINIINLCSTGAGAEYGSFPRQLNYDIVHIYLSIGRVSASSATPTSVPGSQNTPTTSAVLLLW